MIAHVVLIKPKNGLSRDDRRAFVAAFEKALKEIPSVRRVQFGRRVKIGAGYDSSASDTADYLACIEFDDVAGLQTYLRHPAHQELAFRFYQAAAAANVYDFELEGVEGLARLLDDE
jgi:Stress responsive A/B Barrel Domain